jgi:hypothetical protein
MCASCPSLFENESTLDTKTSVYLGVCRCPTVVLVDLRAPVFVGGADVVSDRDGDTVDDIPNGNEAPSAFTLVGNGMVAGKGKVGDGGLDLVVELLCSIDDSASGTSVLLAVGGA